MKLEKSSALFLTTVSLFPKNGVHHSCDVGSILPDVSKSNMIKRNLDGLTYCLFSRMMLTKTVTSAMFTFPSPFKSPKTGASPYSIISLNCFQ